MASLTNSQLSTTTDFLAPTGWGPGRRPARRAAEQAGDRYPGGPRQPLPQTGAPARRARRRTAVACAHRGDEEVAAAGAADLDVGPGLGDGLPRPGPRALRPAG